MDNKKYDLVEYSKDFAMSISDYSAYEFDLMLCLIRAARQAIDNRNVPTSSNLELVLKAKNVKENLNGNISSKRLKDAMLNIFDTKVYLKDEENYTKVNHLFEELSFTSDLQNIKFVLKQNHIGLFFNLIGNYTQHRIQEMTSLKGIYAKKIYQFICSYRDLGKKRFDVEFFKKALTIPPTYEWGDINKRVLNPSKKEIKEKIGINIDFEKIKVASKITEIEISWELPKETTKKIVKEENPFADIEPKKPKKDLKAKPSPLTEEEEKEFERLVTEKKVVKPVGLRKGTDIYIKTVKGILENYKKQEGEDEQK